MAYLLPKNFFKIKSVFKFEIAFEQNLNLQIPSFLLHMALTRTTKNQQSLQKFKLKQIIKLFLVCFSILNSNFLNEYQPLNFY
jgi:hypothetical protein